MLGVHHVGAEISAAGDAAAGVRRGRIGCACAAVPGPPDPARPVTMSPHDIIANHNITTPLHYRHVAAGCVCWSCCTLISPPVKVMSCCLHMRYSDPHNAALVSCSQLAELVLVPFAVRVHHRRCMG